MSWRVPRTTVPGYLSELIPGAVDSRGGWSTPTPGRAQTNPTGDLNLHTHLPTSWPCVPVNRCVADLRQRFWKRKIMWVGQDRHGVSNIIDVMRE